MLLRDYLKEHDIRQKAMSEKLGVTLTHLRMLMKGKSNPSKTLAIYIERKTDGEVTRQEAMFPEVYGL